MMLATARWLAKTQLRSTALLHSPNRHRIFTTARRPATLASCRFVHLNTNTRSLPTPMPTEPPSAAPREPTTPSWTSILSTTTTPSQATKTITPWPRPEELPPWAAIVNRDLFLSYGQSLISNMDLKENRVEKNLWCWTCVAHFTIGKRARSVTVMGRNKVHAIELAATYVVAIVHQDPKAENPPPKLVSGAQVALARVYTYCASHGLLPKVAVGSVAVFGRNAKTRYKCSIRLPEQAIAVSSGPAVDVNLALEKASRAFIKAINGRTTGGPSHRPNHLSCHEREPFLKWLAREHDLRIGIRPSSKGDRDCVVNASIIAYGLGKDPKQQLPTAFFEKRQEREALARFQVAVSISEQRPELVQAFRKLLENNKGSKEESKEGSKQERVSPRLAAATPLDISPASHALMQAYAQKRVGPELHIEALGNHYGPNSSRRRRLWSNLTSKEKSDLASALAQAYQRYDQEAPQAIRKSRAQLPVAAYKRELIDLVDNNVYSIFIGATGSGKTTQVPQLIFEDWCRRGRGDACNIICTQPRVIAATSVSRRVCAEMGSSLGKRVGFHTRLHAEFPNPRDGSITFCTTGILLQQLQHEPDYIFDNVSHLILDEVHERDMVLDFTMAVLKRSVSDRLARGLKVPRITLMSATLDKEAFARHFQNLGPNGELVDAPALSVPGRTFPVQEKYLEDIISEVESSHNQAGLIRFRRDKFYAPSLQHIKQELSLGKALSDKPSPETALQKDDDNEREELDWDNLEEAATPIGLIAETVAHVLSTSTGDGAVLVFLPGIGEIRKVEEALREFRPLGVNIDSPRYKIFQLHSSLHDSQQQVFQPVPPGVRKIILSSPVAETSVTIPEVTVVIDSGQVRETHYDQTSRASWLRNSWIHASSAKQRAGRAGRVQEGTYLAMYSRARRDSMPVAGLPELMRTDLQSTCLTVKAKFEDIDVPEFLASAIDPPPAASIAEAMQSLVDTGALTPKHELTSLGHVLSHLQVHPQLGKMILMGLTFKCLDAAVIAGAAIEEQDLFLNRMGNDRQVTELKASFGKGSQSDMMVTYNTYRYIYDNFSGSAAPHMAGAEGFNWPAFKRVKDAVSAIKDNLIARGFVDQQYAKSDGLIGGAAHNVNLHKPHVVKAIFQAGLQGNLAGQGSRKLGNKFYLGDRPAARIAGSSLFNMKSKRPSGNRLLSFGELAASRDGYVLRHVNIMSPLTAALFASSLDAMKNRQTPVAVANKFFPMPVKLQGRDSKDALLVLLRFRRLLSDALNVAFENLSRTIQRRAPVQTDGVPVVEQLVEHLVGILDADAAYTKRILDQEQRDQARIQARRMEAQRQARRNEAARDAWPPRAGLQAWPGSHEAGRRHVQRTSALGTNPTMVKGLERAFLGM